MNNKLNCCAYNITRPQKTHTGWVNRGATEVLNANHKGIAKLRQRGFTWTQINHCLERVGVNVGYNNLYQWSLNHYNKR
jgi:hypothetical protein